MSVAHKAQVRRGWNVAALRNLRQNVGGGFAWKFPDEKRAIQRQHRVEDLQKALGISRKKALTYVFRLKELFLRDRNRLVEHLMILEKEGIPPKKVAVEYLTVFGIRELISLCNRTPSLRYSSFFRTGVSVRVVVGRVVYHGKVLSNDGKKVTAQFTREESARCHSKRVGAVGDTTVKNLRSPVTFSFNFREPNLSRKLK